MMNRFSLTNVGAANALTFATSAFAGEQYLDETGFAVSGYDVVACFGLAQGPMGQDLPAAVPGKASIPADAYGAAFAFSNEAKRDCFVAASAKHALQYDGHSACGVVMGGKVPANPNLWRIIGDKLCLDIAPIVVGFREADIPGNVTKSENNWVSLDSDPVSDRTNPRFTREAPNS